MSDDAHRTFLRRCIELASHGATHGGGPYGALVTRDGRVIAEAHNTVTADCDPTAHAEVAAIRKACQALGSHQLNGCTVYSSCEPCPMCLGAIYWARAERVYFAATRHEAADAGFDDSFIYREIDREPTERSIPCRHLDMAEAMAPFQHWRDCADKVRY